MIGGTVESRHDGHRSRSISGTRAFSLAASRRTICRAASSTATVRSIRGCAPPTRSRERRRHVVHGVRAQKLIRSSQLGSWILDAALELEHQHLAAELLQQDLQLAAVEAPSE